jgi:hypothetical protein
MIAQANPNLIDAPALVVFGRDATGKPHASQPSARARPTSPPRLRS